MGNGIRRAGRLLCQPRNETPPAVKTWAEGCQKQGAMSSAPGAGPELRKTGRLEDRKNGQPRAGMTNSHTVLVITSSIVTAQVPVFSVQPRTVS